MFLQLSYLEFLSTNLENNGVSSWFYPYKEFLDFSYPRALELSNKGLDEPVQPLYLKLVMR